MDIMAPAGRCQNCTHSTDNQHPAPDSHSKIAMYSNGIKNISTLVKVKVMYDCCSETGLKSCTVKH